MLSYGTPEFRDQVEQMRTNQHQQVRELTQQEHNIDAVTQAHLVKAATLSQTAREIAAVGLGRVRPDLTLYNWSENSGLQRFFNGRQQVIGGLAVIGWNLVDATASYFDHTRGENSTSGSQGLALTTSGDLYTYQLSTPEHKKVLQTSLETPETFMGRLSISGYSNSYGPPTAERNLELNTKAVEHYLMKFAAEKLWL